MRSRLPSWALRNCPLLYLHAALGSLLAERCELWVLASHAPEHVAVAVLLPLGVLLLQTPASVLRVLALLSLAAAGVIAFTATRPFAGALAASLLLGLAAARARKTGRVRWAQIVAFPLTDGALPFLAGYLATGQVLGSSALLLGLGFFATFAGTRALLEHDPAPAPPAPSAETRWFERSNVRTSVSTGSLLLGLAGIGAWSWLYGAGISGIALAAPGGLWFLWAVTGWTLADGDSHQLQHSRRHALPAWLALLVALALSANL